MKPLDNKLVDQYITIMKNIGLFEAKTKFSEICDRVMKDNQPVLITKRGKPLVRIDPIEKEDTGVWDLARKFRNTYGPIKENLELPHRNVDKERKHMV